LANKISKKVEKSKIFKELREWGMFIGLFLILYFTGLYTEIAGGLQRIVLATGLRNAETKIENLGNADFNFSITPLDSTQKAIVFEELKGKVIFLNFWATWCPPCIAEMPSIQALYERIDKEKVVFVMIATNDEEEKVRKFIKRKEFTFPVYILKDHYLPTVFHSKAIPTTFIIDKAGTIVFKHEGTANYDTDNFENMIGGLAQKSF
jgi:thiol-disulfide isomerase/thioredoxin